MWIDVKDIMPKDGHVVLIRGNFTSRDSGLFYVTPAFRVSGMWVIPANAAMKEGSFVGTIEEWKDVPPGFRLSDLINIKK